MGFGDDAAVAGGLVCWDGGGPVFCADAVADPASGLVAAAAVLDALRWGRWLLDVSMSAWPHTWPGRRSAASPAAAPRARGPPSRTAARRAHRCRAGWADPMSLLLRNVEVDGSLVDVRVADGRIAAVAAGLPPATSSLDGAAAP